LAEIIYRKGHLTPLPTQNGQSRVKVHLPYGFSSIKLLAVTATGAKFGPVGYEVILLYFACLAALVTGGSGPFAIDGLIGKRIDARTRNSRILTTAGR
jgi:hypothetical protein